jgi:hypothetical protein
MKLPRDQAVSGDREMNEICDMRASRFHCQKSTQKATSLDGRKPESADQRMIWPD